MKTYRTLCLQLAVVAVKLLGWWFTRVFQTQEPPLNCKCKLANCIPTSLVHLGLMVFVSDDVLAICP